MTILETVTEVEDKVVDKVRTIQEPVVEYVRKGVDLVDGKLPKFTYPEQLPRPGEIVDSQYEFVTSLLGAQRDLVKAVVAQLAPLAGGGAEAPKPAAQQTTRATRPKAKSPKAV